LFFLFIFELGKNTFEKCIKDLFGIILSFFFFFFLLSG